MPPFEKPLINLRRAISVGKEEIGKFRELSVLHKYMGTTMQSITPSYVISGFS
jgi:hypothetical protein